MSYWIDGYNVLHRMKLLRTGSLEEGREQLVARAAALGRPCWIVFDSRERPPGMERRRRGRVTVEFARDGHSADLTILERVRTTPDPGAITVVTDDRELARKCRDHGARTLSVQQFAERILPGTPTRGSGSGPLRKHEVEEWLRWFGHAPDKDSPP